MKRFICFFSIVFILANCFCCITFAGAPSIVLNSAKTDDARSFVNIMGNMSDVAEEQQLTYLLTEVKDGSYNEDNIYYINQKIYTNPDGEFSFKLGVKGTLEADKTYIVRIGGTGISEPISIIVGTDGDGKVEFILGDVNSDGKIDVNDASIGLKYLLDPLSVDDKIVSAERFDEKIKVMGKEIFTAEDVACILQKALNENGYTFPAEKKMIK